MRRIIHTNDKLKSLSEAHKLFLNTAWTLSLGALQTTDPAEKMDSLLKALQFTQWMALELKIPADAVAQEAAASLFLEQHRYNAVYKKVVNAMTSIQHLTQLVGDSKKSAIAHQANILAENYPFVRFVISNKYKKITKEESLFMNSLDSLLASKSANGIFDADMLKKLKSPLQPLSTNKAPDTQLLDPASLTTIYGLLISGVERVELLDRVYLQQNTFHMGIVEQLNIQFYVQKLQVWLAPYEQKMDQKDEGLLTAKGYLETQKNNTIALVRSDVDTSAIMILNVMPLDDFKKLNTMLPLLFHHARTIADRFLFLREVLDSANLDDQAFIAQAVKCLAHEKTTKILEHKQANEQGIPVHPIDPSFILDPAIFEATPIKAKKEKKKSKEKQNENKSGEQKSESDEEKWTAKRYLTEVNKLLFKSSSKDHLTRFTKCQAHLLKLLTMTKDGEENVTGIDLADFAKDLNRFDVMFLLHYYNQKYWTAVTLKHIGSNVVQPHALLTKPEDQVMWKIERKAVGAFSIANAAEKLEALTGAVVALDKTWHEAILKNDQDQDLSGADLVTFQNKVLSIVRGIINLNKALDFLGKRAENKNEKSHKAIQNLRATLVGCQAYFNQNEIYSLLHPQLVESLVLEKEEEKKEKSQEKIIKKESLLSPDEEKAIFYDYRKGDTGDTSEAKEARKGRRESAHNTALLALQARNLTASVFDQSALTRFDHIESPLSKPPATKKKESANPSISSTGTTTTTTTSPVSLREKILKSKPTKKKNFQTEFNKRYSELSKLHSALKKAPLPEKPQMTDVPKLKAKLKTYDFYSVSQAMALYNEIFVLMTENPDSVKVSVKQNQFITECGEFIGHFTAKANIIMTIARVVAFQIAEKVSEDPDQEELVMDDIADYVTNGTQLPNGNHTIYLYRNSAICLAECLRFLSALLKFSKGDTFYCELKHDKFLQTHANTPKEFIQKCQKILKVGFSNLLVKESKHTNWAMAGKYYGRYYKTNPAIFGEATNPTVSDEVSEEKTNTSQPHQRTEKQKNKEKNIEDSDEWNDNEENDTLNEEDATLIVVKPSTRVLKKLKTDDDIAKVTLGAALNLLQSKEKLNERQIIGKLATVVQGVLYLSTLLDSPESTQIPSDSFKFLQSPDDEAFKSTLLGLNELASQIIKQFYKGKSEKKGGFHPPITFFDMAGMEPDKNDERVQFAKGIIFTSRKTILKELKAIADGFKNHNESIKPNEELEVIADRFKGVKESVKPNVRRVIRAFDLLASIDDRENHPQAETIEQCMLILQAFFTQPNMQGQFKQVPEMMTEISQEEYNDKALPEDQKRHLKQGKENKYYKLVPPTDALPIFKKCGVEHLCLSDVAAEVEEMISILEKADGEQGDTTETPEPISIPIEKTPIIQQKADDIVNVDEYGKLTKDLYIKLAAAQQEEEKLPLLLFPTAKLEKTMKEPEPGHRLASLKAADTYAFYDACKALVKAYFVIRENPALFACMKKNDDVLLTRIRTFLKKEILRAVMHASFLGRSDVDIKKDSFFNIHESWTKYIKVTKNTQSQQEKAASNMINARFSIAKHIASRVLFLSAVVEGQDLLADPDVSVPVTLSLAEDTQINPAVLFQTFQAILSLHFMKELIKISDVTWAPWSQSDRNRYHSKEIQDLLFIDVKIAQDFLDDQYRTQLLSWNFHEAVEIMEDIKNIADLTTQNDGTVQPLDQNFLKQSVPQLARIIKDIRKIDENADFLVNLDAFFTILKKECPAAYTLLGRSLKGRLEAYNPADHNNRGPKAQLALVGLTQLIIGELPQETVNLNETTTSTTAEQQIIQPVEKQEKQQEQEILDVEEESSDQQSDKEPQKEQIDKVTLIYRDEFAKAKKSMLAIKEASKANSENEDADLFSKLEAYTKIVIDVYKLDKNAEETVIIDAFFTSLEKAYPNIYKELGKVDGFNEIPPYNKAIAGELESNGYLTYTNHLDLIIKKPEQKAAKEPASETQKREATTDQIEKKKEVGNAAEQEEEKSNDSPVKENEKEATETTKTTQTGEADTDGNNSGEITEEEDKKEGDQQVGTDVDKATTEQPAEEKKDPDTNQQQIIGEQLQDPAAKDEKEPQKETEQKQEPTLKVDEEESGDGLGNEPTKSEKQEFNLEEEFVKAKEAMRAIKQAVEGSATVDKAVVKEKLVLIDNSYAKIDEEPISASNIGNLEMSRQVNDRKPQETIIEAFVDQLCAKYPDLVQFNNEDLLEIDEKMLGILKYEPSEHSGRSPEEYLEHQQLDDLIISNPSQEKEKVANTTKEKQETPGESLVVEEKEKKGVSEGNVTTTEEPVGDDSENQKQNEDATEQKSTLTIDDAGGDGGPDGKLKEPKEQKLNAEEKFTKAKEAMRAIKQAVESSELVDKAVVKEKLLFIDKFYQKIPDNCSNKELYEAVIEAFVDQLSRKRPDLLSSNDQDVFVIDNDTLITFPYKPSDHGNCSSEKYLQSQKLADLTIGMSSQEKEKVGKTTEEKKESVEKVKASDHSQTLLMQLNPGYKKDSNVIPVPPNQKDTEEAIAIAMQQRGK